jgi:RNA polymerase-binding transcription factor DksA
VGPEVAAGTVASIDDALAAEREAASRLVDDLRTELAGIHAAQEADPPDDEHDVEGSSVGFERARVTALLARAEAHVVELAAAAERLAAGTAGRCEVCGGAIGDERLAALPATRRCVGCATAVATRFSR